MTLEPGETRAALIQELLHSRPWFAAKDVLAEYIARLEERLLVERYDGTPNSLILINRIQAERVILRDLLATPERLLLPAKEEPHSPGLPFPGTRGRRP